MHSIKFLLGIAVFNLSLGLSLKAEPPSSDSQRELKKSITEAFKNSEDLMTLVNLIFQTGEVREIENRLRLLKDSIQNEHQPELIARALKIQDLVDQRILSFNLNQRKKAAYARWISVGAGFAGGLAIGLSRAAAMRGSNNEVEAAAWAFLSPTVGTGVGLGVGEILAQSQSRIRWQDLVGDQAPGMIEGLRDAQYKDLGSLVRAYIAGQNDGEQVADVLISDPEAFDVKSKFVCDEIVAGTTIENQRALLLYQLKHKIFRKAAQHNERVFERQDRNRLLGTVGGAAVAGLAGYFIVPRAMGEHSWKEVGKLGLIFMPSFMVSGGALGNLLTPPIEQALNKPAIRMATPLD